VIRIAFDELQNRVERVLLGLGLSPERARRGAHLVAATDRDGVSTHGIARLPRFAEMVRLGRVRVEAVPERTIAAGALERWQGHRGPGNLAAEEMTSRALELAREFGIGAVALGDTNHWQRGGSYGWQAAEAGFALLAWTNTMPNLPAWGAAQPVLGNNPLVIAVPRASGPVVLDMAMSQFSYGALAKYRERGELLPVPGGFDEAGELTRDPGAIERTQRALPVGFWKGSGLAFVLDLLGTMLSGGRGTHELEADPLAETGLSQVFVAVDVSSVGARAEIEQVAEGCIAALHAAEPSVPGKRPRYPGEETLRVRAQSLREGVAVEDGVWARFVELEG
jgi:3-dehydro-L-gulonate 2-dehydrogenase